ncbi:MAG: zinc-dependent peptidase [Flavobacteriaceae bacterium]|nr:zinc-dependent peptidase [Flavobacteriaceae bacterium]
MVPALIILLLIIVLYFIHKKTKNTKKNSVVLSPVHLDLLEKKVLYYTQLSPHKKALFRTRISEFLSTVKITGIETTVEAIDEILIASGAIIPIFGFKTWKYSTLQEVLLYKKSFTKRLDFTDNTSTEHITGMVGTGSLNNIMILSQPALHHGFSNTTDKKNVAIHEFIHLIDKEDMNIDGIPKVLMDNQISLPWTEFVRKKINDINRGKSDIRGYGGSSAIEFYAVVGEYFFERPKLLKRKHPELYALLSTLFKQQ